MASLTKFITSTIPRPILLTRKFWPPFDQNVMKITTVKNEKLDIPPKPKKPLNPYLLYIRTIRPQIVKESPGMRASAIMTECAKQWAALDLTHKEQFKNKYEEELKQYQQKLEAYKSSLTDDQKLQSKLEIEKAKQRKLALREKQKKKEFQMPKKPPNAFLIYVKESKPNHEVDRKEFVKKCKEEWSTMPIDQKEHYIKMGENLMREYQENLQEWEQYMVKLGHSNLVRRKSLAKLNASGQEDGN